MKKDRNLHLTKLEYKNDGRRKLLEGDIEEIRLRFDNGESCFKLADDFNVAVSTIRYWTNEDIRKNTINLVNFRNKMYPKEKDIRLREVKKSRAKHNKRIKEYSKAYHKKVWKDDEEFVERNKLRCKIYASRNKKKLYKLNKDWRKNNTKSCLDCGKDICYKAKRCRSCAMKLIRKNRKQRGGKR